MCYKNNVVDQAPQSSQSSSGRSSSTSHSAREVEFYKTSSSARPCQWNKNIEFIKKKNRIKKEL